MHYQNPCELLVIKIPVIYFLLIAFFILIAHISCPDLNVSERGKHTTEEKESDLSLVNCKASQVLIWPVSLLQNPGMLFCSFKSDHAQLPDFFSFFFSLMPGGCHRNKGTLVNKLQSLKNKMGFGYKSSFQLTKLCSPPH